MIPIALLVLTPFVAKDAGLRWNFDGTSTPAVGSSGRYDLVGKSLRGEIAWFLAPKRRFDVEALYKSDTQRTKEADEAKGFTHVRMKATLAGISAIRSDQWYEWSGAKVASRCLYAAQGDRAWVVRLWWSPLSNGDRAADAFLKSLALVAKPSPGTTRSPSR